MDEPSAVIQHSDMNDVSEAGYWLRKADVIRQECGMEPLQPLIELRDMLKSLIDEFEQRKDGRPTI